MATNMIIVQQISVCWTAVCGKVEYGICFVQGQDIGGLN